MTRSSSEHEPQVGQDAAQPERSGADVAEAVDTAADGTAHGGVQSDPADMKPHAAPVEQVQGDPSMTEGQVVDGPGTGSSTPPQPGPVGSGGAQAVVGPRESDRLAGGGE